MILADTSVLIRHFRSYTDSRQRLIETIDPAVCGLTVAEFGAGARTPSQVVSCAAILAFFQRIPIAESVWEAAGCNQARLASSGLIVPLPDTLIATVAIDAGLELWTYDTHFAAMAALLSGLRLFHEPP
ncbi:MAG TPA: PIN domain-containing protein [Gemmataceae bacterium]|nr:PIN domain-containing protein [Gemmataceae bacterium]